VSSFLESTLTALFLYIVVAQSWNLIGGMAGYASFGQVAFYGVGGYAVALLMLDASLSFWVALPLAAVVAGAYGLLLGLPLLRLHGEYFAVATLVAAAATQALASWQPAFTSQGAGLTITTVGTHQTTPYLGAGGFTLLFAGLALFSVCLVGILTRTRLGYALRVVRDDERLARAVGVRAGATKLTVFAVSAALAGLAGGASAFRQVTVTPSEMFNPTITVLTIAMVVLGGAGTVLGPVVGAIALTALTTAVDAVLPTSRDLVLALVILAAVVFVPRGIGRGGHSIRLPAQLEARRRPRQSTLLR